MHYPRCEMYLPSLARFHSFINISPFSIKLFTKLELISFVAGVIDTTASKNFSALKKKYSCTMY